jgi:predicted nuclease of predicted toxin-antitoxin system
MDASSGSSELTYYFDESVELAVSEQLAASGLDVISAHSLEALGDDDLNHLQRASAMGRVLCTYDADFLRLAADGAEHCGIIFAQQRKATIGGWVREIRALHARFQSDELIGQVVFLSYEVTSSAPAKSISTCCRTGSYLLG